MSARPHRWFVIKTTDWDDLSRELSLISWLCTIHRAPMTFVVEYYIALPLSMWHSPLHLQHCPSALLTIRTLCIVKPKGCPMPSCNPSQHRVHRPLPLRPTRQACEAKGMPMPSHVASQSSRPHVFIVGLSLLLQIRTPLPTCAIIVPPRPYSNWTANCTWSTRLPQHASSMSNRAPPPVSLHHCIYIAISCKSMIMLSNVLYAI